MGITDQGIPEEQTESPEDRIRSLIHRLNNHLTTVVGYGHLLLDDAGDQDVREYATRIVNEGEKATQVGRDLLSMVRASGSIGK